MVVVVVGLISPRSWRENQEKVRTESSYVSASRRRRELFALPRIYLRQQRSVCFILETRGAQKYKASILDESSVFPPFTQSKPLFSLNDSQKKSPFSHTD